YAVCRSLRAGTVYGTCPRRFSCRPIRVQHGLYSSTDVVLTHDLKLYILTDRSTNSSINTSSYTFQTLLVYDLIKRSCEETDWDHRDHLSSTSTVSWGTDGLCWAYQRPGDIHL
ncbi:hypothetical protein KUCAC02_000617, partial [Chaenocephalus aceratus]